MEDIRRQKNNPTNLRRQTEPDEKRTQEIEKVKAVHLLDDNWFFGNLLVRKSRILRTKSDPFPSSSSSRNKNDGDDEKKTSTPPILKHSSLPASYNKEEDINEEEDEEPPRMADLIRQASMAEALSSSTNKFGRAPSLPPCEVMSRLPVGQKDPLPVGKLTRRATIDSSRLSRIVSMDSSAPPPPSPRRNNSDLKGKKPGYSTSSIPKAKPQAHRKAESTPNFSNYNNAYPKPGKLHRSKSFMSTHELEIQELQGFKDLGFSFDNKEDICPAVAKIIPALSKGLSAGSNNGSGDDDDDHHQKKKSDDKVVIRRRRKPYLSEVWENKTWINKTVVPPPPIVPKCIVDKKKNGSSEDMKAQIKFWARSVASNVRQEC